MFLIDFSSLLMYFVTRQWPTPLMICQSIVMEVTDFTLDCEKVQIFCCWKLSSTINISNILFFRESQILSLNMGRAQPKLNHVYTGRMYQFAWKKSKICRSTLKNGKPLNNLVRTEHSRRQWNVGCCKEKTFKSHVGRQEWNGILQKGVRLVGWLESWTDALHTPAQVPRVAEIILKNESFELGCLGIWTALSCPEGIILVDMHYRLVSCKLILRAKIELLEPSPYKGGRVIQLAGRVIQLEIL